ncbi:AAA family ATPase [Pareuzebyella sediminis]|uniref:AAA family ATPase n=1 Tax=Pareuzebyella sediminis TaxID=2607998 RepID=UPI0011EC2821|nr:ATP-binding protein [Pareuzebyella sediminis]
MITFTRLSIVPLGTKKIVITGGPSTGKTSVIQNLEAKGFTCVHELIRSMTASEKNGTNPGVFTSNPIVSVDDPVKFNKQLLKGRIEQYKSSEMEESNVIFFDRGIPDVHAYMNCFGQSYDKAFEAPAYQYRYQQILIMPPWQDIHVVDEERFESFEESQNIYAHLKDTYENFGYSPTIVPKGSIEERTAFIIDILRL